LHRKIRRLCTAKDATDIFRGTPEHVRGVHPIGQKALLSKRRWGMDLVMASIGIVFVASCDATRLAITYSASSPHGSIFNERHRCGRPSQRSRSSLS
jgi:hypothetical protein